MSKHKSNLTGKIIGRLTIIEDRGARLLCQCSCGKKKEISRKSFFNKRTKSCGCLQKEVIRNIMQRCRHPEFIGKRFGKLVILEWAGMKKIKSQGISSWLCQCDCGNKKIIIEQNLTHGRSLSCGCGCFKTHGMCKSHIYIIWANKKNTKKLDSSWNTFEIFYQDTKDSYQEGFYLTRPDTTRLFEKNNFEWKKKQQKIIDHPKFTYDIDGIIYTRADISKLLKVSRERVRQLDMQGYLVGRVLMALDGV
jgi:hypothetical protein